MLEFSVSKTAKALPLWILVLVIPLLKSSETLDQGLLIRFLSLQLMVFLLLAMMLLSIRKNLRIYRSPLLLSCFLFIFYTGLHLFWGHVYSDSIFDWLKSVSYFLLLILLIQLFSYTELKSGLSASLSILGVVLVILGAIELFQLLQTGKLNIPLSTYQIKAVFGHRNLYVQILFLSFPFQVYRLLTEKPRLLKIFYGFFAGITLFMIIVLSNRAVWLAIVVGLGFILVLHFLRKRKKYTYEVISKKNLRMLALSLGAVLILSGLFFVFYTDISETEKHLSNIVKLENGSGKDRVELWKRTLKIIEEKPLLGYGAENWKIEMLKYGSKGLVSENNITFYQRPHNDFLWIFSEFGFIGGLLYLLLFVLAFTSLISQILSKKESQNILFNYAVFYGLAGFTVFSLLSFPHERIVHNILFSVFLAVIITGYYKDKPMIILPKQGLLKLVFYLISVPLLIVSIVFGYQRFISESHTRKALLFKMENRHSSVITEISKAASPFYQMDPLSTPLSWYRGLAWYQTSQVDSALKYFSQAYKLNPYHVHVLNNLASAYGQKGENEEAISYYKKAINIYPEFEDAAFNLCAVYYNTGLTDSAFAVLKNISINSVNPKYKAFLKVVLKDKIIEILKENEKENWIESLPDDEEWYYQLYIISESESIPINLLIFEALEFTIINNSL